MRSHQYLLLFRITLRSLLYLKFSVIDQLDNCDLPKVAIVISYCFITQPTVLVCSVQGAILKEGIEKSIQLESKGTG